MASRISKLPSPPRPPWKPLSADVVLYYRRERFVAAVAAVAHERGAGELTAARICRAARCARKTYYDLFGTTSECLRCSFAIAFARIFGPLRQAAEEQSPEARSGRPIAELLRAIVEEPQIAELCLVHSSGRPVEAEGSDFTAATNVLIGALEWPQGSRSALNELRAATLLSAIAADIRRGRAALLPEREAELLALVSI